MVEAVVEDTNVVEDVAVVPTKVIVVEVAVAAVAGHVVSKVTKLISVIKPQPIRIVLSKTNSNPGNITGKKILPNISPVLKSRELHLTTMPTAKM